MFDLVQRMSLLISIEVFVLLATSDEKGNDVEIIFRIVITHTL